MELNADECDFLIELLQRALATDVDECEQFFQVDSLVIHGKLWDQSDEQTRLHFPDVTFDDIRDALNNR